MANSVVSFRYAPPPERFGVGTMGIAFFAHGLLIAALTWGTQWKSEHIITTATAELWAELPQQAAPRLPPEPVVPAEPKPEPIVEKPLSKPPAIVTEKSKPVPDKKLNAKKKAQEEAEERERERRHQDNVLRSLQSANNTQKSTTPGTGTAAQNAAPSAEYEALIKSLIAPHITYANPDFDKQSLVAEVSFRLAPDGTIIAPTVNKSSGSKEWDAVAIRAVEKTGLIPRDKKGYRPSDMIVLIRPKDKK